MTGSALRTLRAGFAAAAMLGVLAGCALPPPYPPPDVGNCDAPAAPGVDWHNCDKSNSILASADLSGADLSGANLTISDLWHADLSGANLTNADLSYTNMLFADLTGAKLSGADLTDADLFESLIEGADLAGADLSYADLTSAAGTPVNADSATYLYTFCPDGSSATSPLVCTFEP
jgi:uncharacterized protein YjbI with pentapeptide repeats